MTTIGSTFSGIGGLDQAVAEHYDAQVAWCIEQNTALWPILEQRYPNAPIHDDIRTATEAGLDRVDIICGGFPCQDISQAGRGAGLNGARSGLWYDLANLISHLRPGRVVLENVGALRARGLDTVTWTLADLGYVGRWGTVRASDTGAPHQRQRVFIVAARADPDDT